MSDSTDNRDSQATSFLQRWSQRKQEQAHQPVTSKPPVEHTATEPAPETASAQVIPDVDSLNENSEVSAFFTEQVSETLKRKALRKLFHMDKFNICDGLDDYAEDYTLFEPLGDVLTAHQTLRKESESLKELASNESQDLEHEQQHEQVSEDISQQAEHDTKSSSFEEQLTDNDESHTGNEQQKG